MAALATLLTLLSTPPAVGAQASNQGADFGVVHGLYLIPADRQPVAGFATALHNALVHVQRWYAKELGGRTFALATPVVRVVNTKRPADWYNTNPLGADRRSWYWNNSMVEATGHSGGAIHHRRILTVGYIDVDAAKDHFGGALSAVTVLPREQLLGLIGKGPHSFCRHVGVLAHEIGHTFGLPHPAECERPGADNNSVTCQSLMSFGFIVYPQTKLIADNVAHLRASPFITPVTLPGSEFDCTNVAKLPAQPGGRIARRPAPYVEPFRPTFDTDTDRPGHDYASRELPSPATHTCQNLCRDDPRCRAWSYVKPGVQKNEAVCWLKTEVASAQKSDCCISGIVPPWSVPR